MQQELKEKYGDATVMVVSQPLVEKQSARAICCSGSVPYY